jgi:hypothetical protein
MALMIGLGQGDSRCQYGLINNTNELTCTKQTKKITQHSMVNQTQPLSNPFEAFWSQWPLEVPNPPNVSFNTSAHDDELGIDQNLPSMLDANDTNQDGDHGWWYIWTQIAWIDNNSQVM